MTMLEKLKSQRDELLAKMSDAAADPEHLWAYQELIYRIEVFEVLQMFHKSAPCTTNVVPLFGHYKMVDAYIHHLATERQYGKQADEIQMKHRKTALDNLNKVINDYQRQMTSFRPASAELYGTEIGKIIQSVLIVWIQHRNCYVDINKIMEEIT